MRWFEAESSFSHQVFQFWDSQFREIVFPWKQKLNLSQNWKTYYVIILNLLGIFKIFMIVFFNFLDRRWCPCWARWPCRSRCNQSSRWFWIWRCRFGWRSSRCTTTWFWDFNFVIAKIWIQVSEKFMVRKIFEVETLPLTLQFWNTC